MAFGDVNQFAAPAAQTASGQTAAIVCERGLDLNILVNVTAVSGTSPSCTFSIEWSPDGVTFGQGDPADVFTAITAGAVKAKQFAVKMPFFRLVWTISGTTPSFTFVAWKYISE